MVNNYNAERHRWMSEGQPKNLEEFLNVDEHILKWIRRTKRSLLRGLSAEFDEARIRRAIHRPFSQQFYYFCGFGFPSPHYRASFFCHLSCTDGGLVVDKKGNIHPDYRKRIERNIESIQGAPEPPL